MPGPEALKFLHDEEWSLKRHPLTTPENSNITQVNEKGNHALSRLVDSKNYVMAGSYQITCVRPLYDLEKDVLICNYGESLRSLRHPYRCAEDISLNSATQLTC